jgi:hypothetical protein
MKIENCELEETKLAVRELRPGQPARPCVLQFAIFIFQFSFFNDFETAPPSDPASDSPNSPIDAAHRTRYLEQSPKFVREVAAAWSNAC